MARPPARHNTPRRPDLGFDPLGFKSASAADVLTYKERELANGRLATMAIGHQCVEGPGGMLTELHTAR